jgi:hypothetical protein
LLLSEKEEEEEEVGVEKLKWVLKIDRHKDHTHIHKHTFNPAHIHLFNIPINPHISDSPQASTAGYYQLQACQS